MGPFPGDTGRVFCEGGVLSGVRHPREGQVLTEKPGIWRGEVQGEASPLPCRVVSQRRVEAGLPPATTTKRRAKPC